MIQLLPAAAKVEPLDPDLLLRMVKGWLPDITAFGYRLLAAFLIFIVGRKLIKLIQRVITKTFTKADLEAGVSSFLHSLISAGLHGILIFIIAGQIGVDSASIIALLGSASLAIGLAVQGSLANFAGGVMILMMKPFKVGDYIITKTGEGTVSVIGLVYTTLMSMDNKSIVIPNGTLANESLINVTSQEKRRLDLKVGISYGSDLKKAKEIILSLYENHPAIMEEDPIDVYVDELASNSVIVGARGWVSTDLYWAARWEIMEEIKMAFDREGVVIPYPQMDVHIRDGRCLDDHKI